MELDLSGGNCEDDPFGMIAYEVFVLFLVDVVLFVHTSCASSAYFPRKLSVYN